MARKWLEEQEHEFEWIDTHPFPHGLGSFRSGPLERSYIAGRYYAVKVALWMMEERDDE